MTNKIEYKGCEIWRSFSNCAGELFIPYGKEGWQIDHASSTQDGAMLSIDSYLQYGDVLNDPNYSIPF